MSFLKYGKDGGDESTVWGFWLVEIKSLFSAALLVFENGSREAYHSHAFNSLSWVLKGGLYEDRVQYGQHSYKVYYPSLKPVFTSRDNVHKVTSIGRTWVITFRGPWAQYWWEWFEDTKKWVTLTHGRKIVLVTDDRN